MNEEFGNVDALFLDCDGVILDSVKLKEDAFRAIIVERIPQHVEKSMEYFLANGGTSRIKKFEWIWDNLVGEPLDAAALDELGCEFADGIYQRMLKCPYVGGAEEFLEAYHQRWPCHVISGTPDPELNAILRGRGMGKYFAGIHGSPRNKIQIGEALLAEHGYQRSKVWFVGDATTDRDAARGLDVRFVGIDGPHLTPYLDGNESLIQDMHGLAPVLTRSID
ncbi:haloacid dehalogenase-like hydrolase [Planctomycetes bacterium Pan216]|uniref:phosphoglycolate phosphatase n=1 Tax=Kolteria novifilia TaxID=2527975 RepID=A0A518BAR0_9BACT|nr:haloacid dehalogenase-like hydrolase [Planctomycetes bacterium Pan216]